MKPFCIQSKNLVKVAGRTLIHDINFTACSGEIHAVIGNNGEGKTVFANLLSGIRSVTSGSIFLDAQELHITDVVSGQAYGIYMLPQEPVLFPHLSVRDNILAGNESRLGWRGLLAPSKKRGSEICRQYLSIFGLEDLDLDASLPSLNAYEKLMIQLCRILICKPRVLILDEPCASLTARELKCLFDFLEEYKKTAAIIVITHSYSALLRYCDRMSVIHEGRITASLGKDEFGSPHFRRLISELKMDFTYPSLRLAPGRELMELKGIRAGALAGAGFVLHEKEIIGIAGLKADQRRQFLKLLFGSLKPAEGGVLSFPGFKNRPAISFISDQNANKPLFLSQSIDFNITASDFQKTGKYGFSSRKNMRMYGRLYLKKLAVKDADLNTKTVHLSTGTKQKLVIARSLFNKSNIYVYDDPSKNLDPASQLDLCNILNALALNGAGILLISSNYDELVHMCSRVIVFKNGNQIRNYSTNYLSAEALSNELDQ